MIKKLSLFLILLVIPFQSFAVLTTETFKFTNATSSWIVPSGVTSATITAVGGDGGNDVSATAGGDGGVATGTLSVASGTIYYFCIGGQGIRVINGGGGFCGGGDEGSSSNANAAGGGGMTWFSASSSFNSSTVIMVAGGGGGASTGIGGDAGGATSTVGGADGACIGGGGGTQTAGGTGGAGTSPGISGTEGQGGKGAPTSTNPNNAPAGGGGGGFFGGGGGGSTTGVCRAGGGGGSSFHKSTLTSTSTAINLANDTSSLTILYDLPATTSIIDRSVIIIIVQKLYSIFDYIAQLFIHKVFAIN